MQRNRRARRCGAIMVEAALMLVVLLGFVALVVDLGLFYTQQAELQVAADAAAAGAALELPNSVAATAVQLVEANLPSSTHGTVLANSDVEVGHWDEAGLTFTPGATPENAVRVTTRKAAANGNAAQWLVGAMFGLTSVDLGASSTGVLLPELAGALSSGGSISVTGDVTIDSYDSSTGSYDPATAGEGGDIAANGDVSVSGSGTINGDVHGSTVSVGGSGTVTGSTSPQRRPLVLPSVDTTEISADNDNDSLPLIQKGNKLESPLDADRNFVLNGGVEYDIPPGNYYFNDLSLGGQSSLRVSGPTTIYLTGNLDTSGGDVINSTQDPNNLRIFMTGGTADINASVDWYGLLYAPDTDVTISGSADIYGAIVGQDVVASGGGTIHFDTSLTIGDQIDGLVKRSTLVQ